MLVIANCWPGRHPARVLSKVAKYLKRACLRRVMSTAAIQGVSPSDGSMGVV